MTAPSPGAPVAADAAPMNRLAGRDRELRVLQDAVARPGDGTHLVVIRGEAGIGKSTLWRAGVDHARRRRVVTLVSRAAEDELPGPVVGLVDLFEAIDGSEPALADGIGPFERGRAVAAIRAVVAPIVGSVPRRALEQICSLSGGNPMYAIELARAFDRFEVPLDASVPPTLVGAVASSVATVEAHLTRIYRKLHIRSRTELARGVRSA